MKKNRLAGIFLEIALAVQTLFSGSLFVNAADMDPIGTGSFEIEQIQASMPEINIHLRSDRKPEEDSLAISMDEKEIKITSIETSANTGESICYFVLVDISGSIPDKHFNAEKEVLSSFAETLGDQTFVLISFGEKVTVEFKGTGEEKEKSKEVISQLKNQDNETHLFEAIEKTADIADGMPGIDRKIVVVFSDGEDIAKGKTTRNEMLDKLEQRNLPLFAFGINSAKAEYLNSFGETARSLGGELYIFSGSNLKEQWNNWAEEIEQTYVIQCEADTNVIDNKMHTVIVAYKENGIKRTREVLLNSSIPDETAPQILSVVKETENEIRVIFSESVKNADETKNYILSRDGENVPVLYAKYGDTESEAILGVQDLYTGNYRLEATGVTDISKESNRVETVFEIRIEGKKIPQLELEPQPEPQPEQESQPEPKPVWQTLFERFGWLAAVLAVVIFAIIFACMIHRIKKRKLVVTKEGQIGLLDQVEERQRIHVENGSGTELVIDMLNTRESVPKQIHAVINGSMIVGRASFCDLSFDDEKMSKQHFALELEEGKLFITDLNSTNGTRVNGVKLIKKRLLEQGDQVEAGSLRMRIRVILTASK